MKRSKRSSDGRYLDDYEVEDGDPPVRVPMMLCDSLAGYRPGFVQLSDEQIKARWEARDTMIRSAQKAWRGPIETAAAREDVGSQPARMESLACGRRAWASPLTPEQVAAYDARRRKPDPEDDPDEDDDDDNEDTRDAARVASYQAMCLRLQDAWKRPPSLPRTRDAAEPDNSSSPETMRKFLRGSDDPEDAQAKRDQAYEEYAASISQAWKTAPPLSRASATDPSAASRVERIGEQTRGGK
jgi:hypothetical protein